MKDEILKEKESYENLNRLCIDGGMTDEAGRGRGLAAGSNCLFPIRFCARMR